MANKVIFGKPESMKDAAMHYCPGCGHGVVHRLICEVIDELGLKEKTIGVAPVGCSVLAYDYWDFDMSEAAHGRAAAVATGIKRVWPDRLVISYQGDGDLASIGMGETIHAANRGEHITVIFINNANYGMTGGQMAPTTLVGQKTSTTPLGRDPATAGYPLCMAEIIASLSAVRYSVRTAVADFRGILQTKMAIKKAFELQMKGEGYTFVEILANCNTNWEMTPVDANKFILEKMVQTFPLGTFKDERSS